MTLVGCFSALDRVVELRAPRAIATLLADALGDLAVDQAPTARVEIRRDLRGRWSARSDGDTVPLTDGGADLGFYEAIGSVSDLAARSVIDSAVALHASCVDVGGTAVAMAGASGAGKSTLAAALALSGRGFLADEVTAISTDGGVRPFHRPIGLRPDGAAALGVTIPDGPYEYTFPLRMGGRATLSNGARLGAVVLVRRGEGPEGTHQLDSAHGLFRLANMTLGTAGHERAVFRRLEALVHSVPIYELSYQDVNDGVGLVETIVDGLGTDGV